MRDIPDGELEYREGGQWSGDQVRCCLHFPNGDARWTDLSKSATLGFVRSYVGGEYHRIDGDPAFAQRRRGQCDLYSSASPPIGLLCPFSLLRGHVIPRIGPADGYQATS
jgi:hypothetical protein